MTNDFAADFAADIRDVFVENADILADSPYYVTLYDETGTELDGDVQNGRVEMGELDWQIGTDTDFENALEIDFGEALGDFTVQEFGLKAEDLPDADTTVYFRAEITNAPQDFAQDTRVFYEPGELAVDILD